MSLELREGLTVEATCSRCGESHQWVTGSMNLLPRLILITPDRGKQVCGLNAQFVYSDKITRIVEDAA